MQSKIIKGIANKYTQLPTSTLLFTQEVGSLDIHVQGPLFFQFIMLYFVFKNSQDLQFFITQNTNWALFLIVSCLIFLGTDKTAVFVDCLDSQTLSSSITGAPLGRRGDYWGVWTCVFGVIAKPRLSHQTRWGTSRSPKPMNPNSKAGLRPRHAMVRSGMLWDLKCGVAVTLSKDRVCFSGL